MLWIVLAAIAVAAASLSSPLNMMVWSTCGAAAVVLLAPRSLRQYLRYVAVLYHEAGHAVVALVTGGRVQAIVVHGGGGETWSRGGWRPAISLAGYLFPMLLGALLACWGRMPPGQTGLMAVAVAHLLLLPFCRGWGSILLACGGAALFGLLATDWLPGGVKQWILLAFGTGLILEGLHGIKVLLVLSIRSPGRRGTDADALAREVGGLTFPLAWALLIAVLGLAIVAGVFAAFAFGATHAG